MDRASRYSLTAHVLPVVLLAMSCPRAAGAAEAPDPLAGSRSLLVQSAAQTDPDKAKELAESALPAIKAAAAEPSASCDVLVLEAEAELRAMHPKEAKATLARAGTNHCDDSVVWNLHAWSLEFNDAGVRRGPGAPLKEAYDEYLKAALSLHASPTPVPDLVARAFANAAEIAAIRGDKEQCRRWALSGLTERPSRDQQIGLALDFLECGGPVAGEGTSLDRIVKWVDKDTLLTVIGARLKALRARLDKGHDEAAPLVAVAFYAIATGDEHELYNGEHYLVQAAALDEKQPELWYLMGRAHELLGVREEASDNYWRQIHDHPDIPATRLAINDLANMLAGMSTMKAQLPKVLDLLNAEIAKTPDEAAMYDTRARILAALGRRDEAIRDYEKALAMSGDVETRMALENLRSGK